MRAHSGSLKMNLTVFQRFVQQISIPNYYWKRNHYRQENTLAYIVRTVCHLVAARLGARVMPHANFILF